jgi:hypothetical protein
MHMTRSSIPFILFWVLFALSIFMSYYSKVVLKDYEIIMNEDGLPVLDEE